MIDTNIFQLYLLSKMRADKEVIQQAINSMGASYDDLQLSTQKMISIGFETLGHSATLYSTVLGEPYVVEPDVDDVPPSFLGSFTLRFKLPLWPLFDFVVHQHPSGYAWNMGFSRSKSNSRMPTLECITDLVPWNFTSQEITGKFGQPKQEDAWSGWEDLSYRIPEFPGGYAKKYLLRFDFNLYQSFRILQEKD